MIKIKIEMHLINIKIVYLLNLNMELTNNSNTKSKSTYFYNILKNDENVIDEYRIWYNNSQDTYHLYECYEFALGEFVMNKNIEHTMNYCACDEEKENDNKKTLMSYKSKSIDILISVINIDDNNLHVKITLINLASIPSNENSEYGIIENLMKKCKEDIIDINKYLNNKPRSKEERDLNEIDMLMEQF
jgi:hypothetical protein